MGVGSVWEGCGRVCGGFHWDWAKKNPQDLNVSVDTEGGTPVVAENEVEKDSPVNLADMLREVGVGRRGVMADVVAKKVCDM